MNLSGKSLVLTLCFYTMKATVIHTDKDEGKRYLEKDIN
jgi:hypothetical protein